MSGDSDKGYLNRNIIGLSLTSLLTDISSESVYAVLPFYITSLGLGRSIVGLVEGLGEFFSSIFKFLSGYIAQVIGKYKLLTLLGYLLSTIVKPFFALTKTGYGIAFIKIIDRIGKGVRTSPRDALLASSVSSGYRGRAFGLHRALDTVGAVLGPLLAIILLSYYGYVGVFLFSLVPGLLAVFILLIIVEEKSVKKESSKLSSLISGLPSIYWLFISTIIASGLTGYTQAFLLLRAREIGWSEEYSIGFLVLANTVYALTAYPIGHYSDVLKKGVLYPFIFVIQLIGVSTIIVYTDNYSPLLFFIIYGLYMGFHDTLMRIMTSIYVKKYLRGIGYGIMHSSYGLSTLTGYYILGLLYDIYGYRSAYTYSMIIGFIGLVLSIILVSKTKSEE